MAENKSSQLYNKTQSILLKSEKYSILSYLDGGLWGEKTKFLLTCYVNINFRWVEKLTISNEIVNTEENMNKVLKILEWRASF